MLESKSTLKEPKELRKHREELRDNPNAYTQDLKRIRAEISKDAPVVNLLKKCGYKKVTRLRCGELIKEFVDLIFKTQNNLPFFYIEEHGELPFCWNNPGDWEENYIRYEWGHLQSRNQNKNCDEITNFCLQSARCNRQVQTSMDIREVKVWLKGSRIANRIDTVMKKREELFVSKEWKNLLSELENFR